jgi:hypothetical protein
MSRPTQSSRPKTIEAIFFRTAAGGEPVRQWLKSLSPIEDRKQIGVDIKVVEFGWPIGMPVCRPLGDGLYEVRSSLSQNRIARVLFYIDVKGRMVCCTALSRRLRRLCQQTWNWPERIRLSMRAN